MIQRKELARRIAPLVSLTIPQALVVVDSIFDELSSALARGEDASVFSFGEFLTSVIPAHIGKNPRTQEDIPVKARRTLRFKMYPALRNRLQENLTIQKEAQQ